MLNLHNYKRTDGGYEGPTGLMEGTLPLLSDKPIDLEKDINEASGNGKLVNVQYFG